MQPSRRSSRARGLNYQTWYEHIGRPNKLPYRPRGSGARHRRVHGAGGRVLQYQGSLYSLGDIACGDRTTPATADAVFSPAVEMWRALVSSYAGNIPVNFLMAWIQIESCGSGCSWTSSSEAGIFQLMPPDNTNVAGTSVAALHPQPPCGAGNSMVYMTSFSDDQQVEQVSSGLRFVNYCRDQAHLKLAAAGQDWSEDTPDFWMMTKLVHALPGIITPGLVSAANVLGYSPTNWNEFLAGSARNYTTAIANAQWTGSFGIGGGGGGIVTILALLGLGYLAYRLSS